MTGGGYTAASEQVEVNMGSGAGKTATVCGPFTKIHIIVIVCVVVGVGAIVGIAVGVTQSGDDDDQTQTPTPQPPLRFPAEERIDCYPEEHWATPPVRVTRETCEERGCTYDDATAHDPAVPSCFVGPESRMGAGYRVTAGGVQPTDHGFVVELEPRDAGMYVGLLSTISLEVQYKTASALRFKFYDPSSSRYEVPEQITRIRLPHEPSTEEEREQYRYAVNITSHDPFHFMVTRRATGAVLWDTSVGGLMFADQFLSISTRLPSANLYGLGENTHHSFRHDLNYRTWGMFARDQWVDYNLAANHYGVHPFYTCLEEDGKSHGVLLLNSNAMDYSVTPLPMLTYRAVGGVLDFYMFVGPTPENVVQEYTQAVGRPYFPPYWSLGFQLCRYGYNHIDVMKAAVSRTIDNGIPLDVQYADIDHYDERKVFTIDKVNYDGLPEYFSELREGGIHTIIILDPCLISNETDYAPYDVGFARDLFIKWPNRETMPDVDYEMANKTLNMLGYVWPKGPVAFPDFFHNNTAEFWQQLIVDHIDEIDFDGLWIDMNEPANFGTNEDRPWNWPEKDVPYWSLHCPKDGLDAPPYKTMAAFYHGADKYLADKTLCMCGTQGQGKYSHYDVHSLYGASQIESSLDGLREATLKRDGEQRRGIVVSRSTFPGSGEKSGHWLGDNFAEWPLLHHSIVGMLEFNLFGIPYIGADICGFFGNTTVELCKRWMALGAFYPYSRNHNDANSRLEQDPGNLGAEVIAMSRASLTTRYELLPYLYTCFYHAHTTGSTVVRPLFHEFPQDSNTWGIDTQFLWGGSVLISPILYEDQTELEYYLPAERWYNYYDSRLQNSDGAMVNMDVQADSWTPVHVRGGTVLAIQESANNTVHSRQKPLHLRVYLDDLDMWGGQATGDLYWDTGDSIDPAESGEFFYVKYSCSGKVLASHIQHANVSLGELQYASITISGVAERPGVVLIGDTEHGVFSFQREHQILEISDVFLPLGADFTVEWRSQRLPTEEELERVNCMPEGGSKDDCERKRCLWDTSAPQDVPTCYIDKANYGYTYEADGSTPTDHFLEPVAGAGSMFGGDAEALIVRIDELDNDVLHIVFSNPTRESYNVPVPIDRTHGDSTTKAFSVQTPTDEDMYDLKVKHESSGLNVLDLSLGGLTVSPQFLQLVTRLPSRHIYGFGENRHPSFRHNMRERKTWPMFSRDQPPGWGEGNLYGVHPYYMCVENEQGSSHGVLILNSNAMEVELSPLPALTYRTTGGVLDLYIVFADTPEAVTQRYTKLIGRPYFPAYWSLGFQLCRYGYDNIENLKAAVDRTIEAKIPFDVQYTDIDSFVENKDFTWDEERFPGLPDYIRELQDRGMRMVLILDPAILSTEPDYEVYTSGLAADVYIKWPQNYDHPDIARFNSTYLHGYVWPSGPTVFPDFLKASTKEWWVKHIVDYHGDIPFDGLWIDMNEPANFGTNEDKPWNWPDDNEDVWSLKCTQGDMYEDPPYKPVSMFGSRLSEKTICMVGESTDDTRTYRQYDIHSLFGWSQTEPTLRALHESTGERGIVISRSTYPSSGSMSGHWLGDNDSQWSHLHDSIIGMLEFGLFGIPYIGADICGYFGDTTPEMCLRWMQLGAFYTFSRNHNGLDGIEQDPGALGLEVAEASRIVMEIRYTLLPYLYTLFYTAHTQGNTVIRPLMAEFYNDETALGIDRQFLWGGGLLISPVLEEGETSVDAYFPLSAANNDRWFSYYDGAEVSLSHGQLIRVAAPLDVIPLHVRGGYILPTQQHANTTAYSRQKPFGLIVAPDTDGIASGSMFWDDGVSIDSVPNGNFSLYEFVCETQTRLRSIRMTKTGGYSSAMPLLDSMRVFGQENAPTRVTVTVGKSPTRLPPQSIIYKASTQELKLVGLVLPLSGDFDWEVKIDS